MKKAELIFIIAAAYVGILFFLVYTLNHAVSSADSWYYLNFVYGQWHNATNNDVIIANIFAAAFWFFVLIIFTFAKRKKRNPYFIGALFLLNIFALKFLAPNPNTFLFWIFAFISTLFVYNLNAPHLKNDKAQNNEAVSQIREEFDAVGTFIINNIAKIYALDLLLAYQFFTGFPAFPRAGFGDTALNPIGWIAFMPAAYLLIKNRNWKTLIFVIAIVSMFLQAKFVFEGLPVFIFALYLDFLNSESSFKNQDYAILGFLSIFSLLLFSFTPFVEISTLHQQFAEYCDNSTKICNNDNSTLIGYSNYLAHLGFLVNNSQDYGVCICNGGNCLKNIINCGNSIINTSQIK